MADNIAIFQEAHPSLESYWRSIILFGPNVASYKFALAKSLLEIAPTGKTEITLDELAEPFSRHICEHIAHSPKQVTSSSSQFLDSCKTYNEGRITHNQLLDITAQKAFIYVIDAFHGVNRQILPIKFYTKHYSASSKKIILTDEIFKLQDTPYFDDFEKETESRWRLVETAWEQNISRGLLDIQYSELGDLLYIDKKRYRRKTVTSARAALNGYQKGKCFYCFDDISIGEDNSADTALFSDDIEPENNKLLRVSDISPHYGTPTETLLGLDGRPLTSENAISSKDSNDLLPGVIASGCGSDICCDVDHFFPHTLQRYIPEVNLDGVWNLVLTCKRCNRGIDGKSANIPAVKYLERLHARNEFLINSHHPLRETLMRQTGATADDRIKFLKNMDAFAINQLIHRWKTESIGEEVF